MENEKFHQPQLISNSIKLNRGTATQCLMYVYFPFRSVQQSSPLFTLALGPRNFAVERPGVGLRVEQATDGRIVIEAHLRYLELGIDGHPEGVETKVKLSYVHPLAVDVVAVDVCAVHRDALNSKIEAIFKRSKIIKLSHTLVSIVGTCILGFRSR